MPQEVRRIQHAPSPLEFYREHVASNLPLIVEGAPYEQTFVYHVTTCLPPMLRGCRTLASTDQVDQRLSHRQTQGRRYFLLACLSSRKDCLSSTQNDINAHARAPPRPVAVLQRSRLISRPMATVMRSGTIASSSLPSRARWGSLASLRSCSTATAKVGSPNVHISSSPSQLTGSRHLLSIITISFLRAGVPCTYVSLFSSFLTCGRLTRLWLHSHDGRFSPHQTSSTRTATSLPNLKSCGKT